MCEQQPTRIFIEYDIHTDKYAYSHVLVIGFWSSSMLNTPYLCPSTTIMSVTINRGKEKLILIQKILLIVV